MRDILDKAARIRLVIFDVDGVLTDGSLYLGDDGQEYKAFHSRDGHGMKMLQAAGVEIGIITGRTSEVVRLRMAMFDRTPKLTGEWECMECGYIEEGVRPRRPAADRARTYGRSVITLMPA